MFIGGWLNSDGMAEGLDDGIGIGGDSGKVTRRKKKLVTSLKNRTQNIKGIPNKNIYRDSILALY